MAFDFPSSPTLNQTYTYSGRTWKWNGSAWELQALAASISSLTLTSGSFGNTLQSAALTANRTQTFQDATGTVALSTNKLSFFAATTSAELAGVISDETGSGSLVFGTSPTITTSLISGSASFDLINTTATAVNFAGAATSITIGATGGSTELRHSFRRTGNISAASWTTAGISANFASSTYTDTSTAGGGTVASRVAVSLNSPTFASTNAITVTDAANVYISGPPAAGSNTSFTNEWALWVDTGYSRFDSRVGIGTTSPAYLLDVGGTVSFGLSGSGGSAILGQSQANWNFGQLQLTRHASNATPFKMVEFLLNGDTTGATTLTDNVNLVLYTDSAPTTSSTSVALNAQLGITAPKGIRMLVDGSERARVNATGQLLVNTTTDNSLGSSIQAYSSTAPARIDAVGSGQFAAIRAYGYGQNSLLHLFKANGTLASPTTLASGEGIGVMQWWGYDGGAFRTVSEIVSEVDGAVASDNMPTRLLFKTSSGSPATPTTRMYITSAGYVGLGSPVSAPVRQLQVFGSTESNVIMTRTGGGVDEKSWRILTDTSKNFSINAMGDAITTSQVGYVIARGTGAVVDNHQWHVGGSERMRLNSSGNVGLGGSGANNANIYLQGTITGNVSSFSVYSQQTIQSDVTSTAQLFRTNPTTAAAAFTLGSLQHFLATQTAFGAGSTVTNQSGFVAGGSLTGATNNFGFFVENFTATSAGKFAYGIRSQMNVGSGGGTSYFIYHDGTANSYFGGGKIGVGALPSKLLHLANTGDGAQLLVEDTGATGGLIQIANSSTGKTSTDGLLIGYDSSNDVIINNQENTQLKINTNGTTRITIPADGNRVTCTGNVVAPGAVIQVVHAEFTTVSTVATGGVATAITNFTATITPKSSSSKVLAIVHFSGVLDCDGYLLLYRAIGAGADTQIKTRLIGTDRPSGLTTPTNMYYDGDTYAATYLDSPATTSSIVYKIYALCGGCTQNAYINGTPAGGSNAYSGITLMEIGG